MQTEARVGGVVVDGGRAMEAARRPEQQQRHIGTAAHLAAGGLAGIVSKTCTAPLARLTILFQVHTFSPPFVVRTDWGGKCFASCPANL
jgi:solute carrier family 25 phosphate transporter 23/24/25/41